MDGAPGGLRRGPSTSAALLVLGHLHAGPGRLTDAGRIIVEATS
ncbi:hypothetical protein ABZS59_33215 [Streptomyces flaveolus]